MDFEQLERTVKQKKHKSVKKSSHKHNYENCIIKQYRRLGHRDYCIYFTGGKCEECGKFYYKKILWDKDLTNYSDLPIYEDNQIVPLMKKGV